MKKLLTFLTLLTLFFATGWAETKTATLSWAGNGGNGDSGTDLTTSNILNTNNGGYYNGDASFATCNGISKVYTAQSSYGLKLGSSSAVGYMQFGLTNTINPSKITVSAMKYGSDTGEIRITVNGSSSYSTSGAPGDGVFTDIELELDGSITLSTLRVSTTTKRAYVKSITITYEDGGSTPTTYSVTLNQSTGGTISASPTTAAEGATVTLTATPDSGYGFTSWTVLDENADEVTVTNNQFTMPASDVEVEATFTALPTYSITVTGGTASPTSAYAGQTVTVTPEIPSGKIVDTYTVTPSTVTLTPDGDNYTFTMPGEAVSISFTFKDDPAANAATATFDATVDKGPSPMTKNDVTFTVVKGTGSNDSEPILNNGTEYRLYKNSTSTFEVPTGYKIIKIIFTGNSTSNSVSNLSPSTGTYSTSNNVGTWVGETESVTFTANAQARASLITVYYTAPDVTSNIYRVIKTNGETSTAGGWLGNWTNCTVDEEALNAGNANYTVTANAGTTVQFKAGTNGGYQILENNVSAVYGNNIAVTLTKVSSDDSGITYSFTMPTSAVTITANFTTYIPDVYFLSGDLSNWNNGTKMTYNSTDKKYTLRVYFSDEYGYFRFRAGNNSYASGASGDYWPISGLEGESAFGENITLYNGSDKRFRVPAGIYDIEVGQVYTDNWWGQTTVKVTKVEPTLTFNPAAGGIASGQAVTVSSNLYDLLHAIDSSIESSAVSNQVKTDGDYAASVTLTADATVTGRAKYGYIEKTETAEYTIIATYAITCTAVTNVEGKTGGTVTADKQSAFAGETVTLTVTAKAGYEIGAVTVNGSEITANNGVYSFTMPNVDVEVIANFLAKDLVLTIVNDNNKGQVRGIPSTSTVGTKISFTVTPYPGYTVSSVTYSFTPTGGSENTQTLTAPYEFNMPGYDVTVTVTYSEQQSSGGDATDLYHETFGSNSSSARVWDDSYSVKTGVAEVYSNVNYTVTDAKQSKNTMGYAETNTNASSALVSGQGATGEFVVGPFVVANYTDLEVTNYFGMSSGTWSNNSFMKLYYSTDNSTFTEVTRTGSNPTSAVSKNGNYAQATYSLPTAAQSNNLYLKFEFYCYQVDKNGNQIGQAYFDEPNLSGVPSGVMDPVFSPAAGVYGVDIDVTISCSTPGATIYYTTDGTNPTTSSTQYTGEILVSESTTFKAIAVKDGLISEIVTTAYTISKSTETQTVTLNYNEPFTGQDGIGKFTVDNESGFAPVWTLDGSYGMKATSYSNGTNHAATSRLISPYIDMSNAVQPEMSFSHQINSYFTDVENQCTVWIREITNGTPGSWVNIPITFSNVYYQSGNWTNDFFEIDLSNYANKTIQISFLYTNPTEGSGAGTWEIQNFVVADNADYILVNNIAEFLALENGTKAKFKNPVTVLYDYAQNSSSTYQEYIWFKDASGYCQFYLRPTLNSTYDEDTETYTYSTRAKYENGDIIPAGFVVTKNYYENGGFNQAASYDALNAGFLRSEEKGLADPEFISLDDLDQLNANDAADLARWCNHYVTVEKIRILVKDTNFGNNHNNKAFGFCDADDQNATQCSTWGYNKYSDEGSLKKDGTSAVVEVPEPSATTFYNMKAILQIYKSGGTNYWELMPIEFTEWKEEEMTLRTLCQDGVVNHNYKISNNLLGVYSYYNENLDADILWVKDDNGQSIHMVSPEAPYTDNFAIEFEGDEVIPANTRMEQQYYDQSNWCQLILTGKNGNDFVGKIINGGAIQGRFTDKLNPTLEGVTLTAADIYSTSSYTPNYYVPASFVGNQSCNTDMYGEEGHGDFFFMTPKPQEFATIVWAVWDGQKMQMPTKQQGNSHDLTGEFSIDLSMNQAVKQTSGLPSGAYSFHAIIRKVDISGTPALKGQGEVQNNQSASYMVYPLDIDPDNNPSTGINTVDVTGKAVKSIKYVNVAGIVSDKPFSGVNIVVTEYTDGSRSTTKMLRK